MLYIKIWNGNMENSYVLFVLFLFPFLRNKYAKNMYVDKHMKIKNTKNLEENCVLKCVKIKKKWKKKI